ncbi:uncharacterized protein LOC105431184 isoform X2 [Pogonomyrmex barbatus]|uniref:Uncharacterized protein LOC105431184 isoform X2 n=1 Tax=Pogonomyrmex barbatus TaxID=144034 RepID=A0A6I9WK51_9HYME|nr:uncharacterized protein LOC105431184 isoform X2 [Pogonomyrmex barbatus]
MYNALPTKDDDDVHRVGQQRSWPTNGRPDASQARERTARRTAEPYCGSCQARCVGAVSDALIL